MYLFGVPIEAVNQGTIWSLSIDLRLEGFVIVSKCNNMPRS